MLASTPIARFMAPCWSHEPCYRGMSYPHSNSNIRPSYRAATMRAAWDKAVHYLLLYHVVKLIHKILSQAYVPDIVESAWYKYNDSSRHDYRYKTIPWTHLVTYCIEIWGEQSSHYLEIMALMAIAQTSVAYQRYPLPRNGPNSTTIYKHNDDTHISDTCNHYWRGGGGGGVGVGVEIPHKISYPHIERDFILSIENLRGLRFTNSQRIWNVPQN